MENGKWKMESEHVTSIAKSMFGLNNLLNSGVVLPHISHLASRIPSSFSILILLSIFLASAAYAQKPPATKVSFTQEVDVLDEFVERFNNQDRLLNKQYEQIKNRRTPHQTRAFLLKGLFNYQNKEWNLLDMKSFVQSVTDSTSPRFLKFADQNWFAELFATVDHGGKSEKISLILRFEQGPLFSRWLLVGARGNLLKAATADSLPALFKPIDTLRGINPAAHGNDFISLYRALDDRKNLRCYADRNELHHPELNRFLRLLQAGRISISQIDHVVYHFMQVDGWIFTVSCFPYKPQNSSGWLIGQLYPANEPIKAQYRKRILNLL